MAREPIITLKQGKLRGKIFTDFNDAEYFSFQGIPYAKPPIGKLRFKAPLPADPWTGILDATSEGNACLSKHIITQDIIGGEDCLYLNVYTPTLPCETSPLKPVMVWIHGGGFVCGSGNSDFYGPEYLLPHDVVIVSINYRLGIFGFLNFKNPALEVPGNAGLKDQVLALKWVQENITSFGGDSDNVTIFGESAGAASVHLLMLSPMAKGLFHKVIIQSGSALACWAISGGLTDIIANSLTIDVNEEEKILSALEDMNSNELFQLQLTLKDEFVPSSKRLIGPVVEVPSAESAFLLEDPMKIINSGNYSHVPVMIGYCSRDGMGMKLPEEMDEYISDFKADKELCIPLTLQIPKSSDLSKELAEKIQIFYNGNKEAEDNLNKFYRLLSDVLFIRDIYATVKNHVETHSQPIYFYRVSVESELNTFKNLFNIKEPGVSHFDDVGYLFKAETSPKIYDGSIESDAMYRFTKLWTNFAKTSNPNPITSDPLINITWKPAEKNNFHFADLGENLTVGVNPEYTRMKFWDKISELIGSNY